MLKTAETVTYEIFREIVRAVRQFEAERLLVIASPKVVGRITDEESGGGGAGGIPRQVDPLPGRRAVPAGAVRCSAALRRRSEARRGGKGGVSTVRLRCSP